jgi:heme-degrading monooxygenase HmoA
MSANTPQPPYYAAIFTSRRAEGNDGYELAALRMLELAAEQPGYLGVESARGADGIGITVSYWATLEAIAAWKSNAEHQLAQGQGRAKWYEQYAVRIARGERAYASAI